MSVIILLLIIVGVMVVVYSIKGFLYKQKFDEVKYLVFLLIVFIVIFVIFYLGWFFIKGLSLIVFVCKINLVVVIGIVFCIFVFKLWFIYCFFCYNILIYVCFVFQIKLEDVRFIIMLLIGQVVLKIGDSFCVS